VPKTIQLADFSPLQVDKLSFDSFVIAVYCLTSRHILNYGEDSDFNRKIAQHSATTAAAIPMRNCWNFTVEFCFHA
jgi:hypothetical protein